MINGASKDQVMVKRFQGWGDVAGLSRLNDMQVDASEQANEPGRSPR